MNGDQTNPIFLRLQAPLAIALFSASGYWLAHSYEVAYLGVFGVSEAFARVTLSTVISATGSLGSGALAALLLASVANAALTQFSQRTPTPWTRISVSMLSFSVFMTALHVIHFYRWWREWLPVAFVSLVFAALAVFFIFDERRRQTRGLPPDPPLPNLLGPVVPYIGFDGILLLILVFQANSVAKTVGRAHAMRQEQFLTVKHPDESVVLRAYDDLLVAARFDRASGGVRPEVVLISPSKVGVVELRVESLGPLRRTPTPKPAAGAAATDAAGAESSPTSPTPPRAKPPDAVEAQDEYAKPKQPEPAGKANEESGGRG